MKPTAKTISGAKRVNPEALGAELAIKPVARIKEATRPTSATIWRLRTSALPRLQVPGI
jgi:hypothetical protein